MGKLLRLQCEQCGGELVKRENGKYNCLYCSAEYEYSDKEEIILTAMEYKLLLIFLNHRGQTLSRSQILEGIWDEAGDFVNDNTLSVYMKRLRKKLGDTADGQIIRTVRGIGYRME